MAKGLCFHRKAECSFCGHGKRPARRVPRRCVACARFVSAASPELCARCRGLKVEARRLFGKRAA